MVVAGRSALEQHPRHLRISSTSTTNSSGGTEEDQGQVEAGRQAWELAERHLQVSRNGLGAQARTIKAPLSSPFRYQRRGLRSSLR